MAPKVVNQVRCEFNFNPTAEHRSRGRESGAYIRVPILLASSARLFSSVRKCRSGLGENLPHKSCLTDRWLAPREPGGEAEGWDGIAHLVRYNLTASVTQTPPRQPPQTQNTNPIQVQSSHLLGNRIWLQKISSHNTNLQSTNTRGGTMTAHKGNLRNIVQAYTQTDDDKYTHIIDG